MTAMTDSSVPTQTRLSLAGPEAYVALLKPRVMSLAIFTGWAGMVAAPADMPIVQAVCAMIALAAGAGAAGALNMAYDADIDARMKRTAARPVPAGLIPQSEANAFGFVVAALAVMVMALAANYLAAGLLAFTIWWYADFYTRRLKRSSDQNIVIGGLAGALPPLIGWAAATGGSAGSGDLAWLSWSAADGAISPAPLLMVALTFLWTPAHFWALALYKSGDYRAADLPMLPITRGPAAARRAIFIYAVLTAFTGLALAPVGAGGWLTLASGGLGGLGLVVLAARVWRSSAGDGHHADWALYKARDEDKPARDLFVFTIAYLFAMFASVAADALLGLRLS